MPENSDRQLAENISKACQFVALSEVSLQRITELIADYRLAIEAATYGKAADIAEAQRMQSNDAAQVFICEKVRDALSDLITDSHKSALSEVEKAVYERGVADGIESVARERTNNE
jgi:hypothetical protein